MNFWEEGGASLFFGIGGICRIRREQEMNFCEEVAQMCRILEIIENRHSLC